MRKEPVGAAAALAFEKALESFARLGSEDRVRVLVALVYTYGCEKELRAQLEGGL